MTKMYYIADLQGNFYKIGSKGNLVVAKDSGDADQFTLRGANERIGGGRKAKFYTTVEVDNSPRMDDEPVYEAPEYDVVEKPTMFDGLQNNWESILSELCYMSSLNLYCLHSEVSASQGAGAVNCDSAGEPSRAGHMGSRLFVRLTHIVLRTPFFRMRPRL